MIISLEEIKQYLRVDGDYEDSLIKTLIKAAEEYLINAGAVLNEKNELTKLAIKFLCVHWYENREPIGKADELPYGLKHIIAQLKYCYEPPKEPEEAVT